MRRSMFVRSVLAIAALAVVAVSCSDDGDDVTATERPGTEATSATGAPSSGTSVPGVSGLRGDRYCEVLLVEPSDDGAEASVWNTQGLNECPEEVWVTLDTASIAAEQGVPVALLNGPRYWLMDTITKPGGTGEPVVEDFGGIEMFQAATVAVTPEQLANRAPYTPTSVDRRTVFTFAAGDEVYELTDADGNVYVMQSWSQQVDPTLVESDLAGLGDRLELPEGWTYAARTLDEPLDVETVGADAAVLQDELQNSYSRGG